MVAAVNVAELSKVQATTGTGREDGEIEEERVVVGVAVREDVPVLLSVVDPVGLEEAVSDAVAVDDRVAVAVAEEDIVIEDVAVWVAP